MTQQNQIIVIVITIALCVGCFALVVAAVRQAARESQAQALVTFIGIVLIASLLVWAAINGHSPYPAILK